MDLRGGGGQPSTDLSAPPALIPASVSEESSPSTVPACLSLIPLGLHCPSGKTGLHLAFLKARLELDRFLNFQFRIQPQLGAYTEQCSLSKGLSKLYESCWRYPTPIPHQPVPLPAAGQQLGEGTRTICLHLERRLPKGTCDHTRGSLVHLGPF